MGKWFGRSSEVLEAVSNLTDEQAAEALEDLRAVLKDVSLTKGQQAVRVNEIEERVLRKGGIIVSDKTRTLQVRTLQTEILRLDWFNFKAQEFENREVPEDFTDYIPQNVAAQSLYRLLVDHIGHTPLEAAREVVKVCCGGAKERA